MSIRPPASSASTTTARETAYWQDRAALLDPNAYEFVIGTSQSRTVTSGEHWFVVNAWGTQVFGAGGARWYHRQSHVDQALAL